MNTLKTDVAFGASLELKDVSFLRSLAKSNWLTSIYTPPVTAEFLQHVSLKISHGQVHGIIGASGSGKSTLLKVVANKVAGKLDGQLLLNNQPLTKKRFSMLCEYADLQSQLLGNLTVENTLYFHAKLALDCGIDTVNYRIFTLMQQFDLGLIADKLVSRLSESERRRLLVAMHLIKDPVLIVIDDPLKDLDPLSAFQLMSSLQDYVKRQARMALVSMKCPRSDVYQLLSQITLLFYGEVVYSGLTKQMPHYFNKVGYKCPQNENPAVYYLSLASVDRETPESYTETQLKAANLAEIFKERRSSDLTPHVSPNDTPILSCFYGTPAITIQLVTLFSRELTYISRSASFVLSQTLLPFMALIVAVLGASGVPSDVSWHQPKSIAGSLFALILVSGLAGCWTTIVQFQPLRKSMFLEVSLRLYNASFMYMAFLVLGAIFDMLSVGLAAFTFVWKLTGDVQLDAFITIFSVIWCTYYAYKLLILGCCVFSKGTNNIFVFSTVICLVVNLLASGFFKSYLSFTSASEALLPLTLVTVERYTNFRLAVDFVQDSKVANCTRDEFRPFKFTSEFCRWTKGSDYLSDIYPEGLFAPEWWIGPLFVSSVHFVVLILYIFVTPQVAARKLGALS